MFQTSKTTNNIWNSLCIKCGTMLPYNAKFCTQCGCKSVNIGYATNSYPLNRTITGDKLHKQGEDNGSGSSSRNLLGPNPFNNRMNMGVGTTTMSCTRETTISRPTANQLCSDGNTSRVYANNRTNNCVDIPMQRQDYYDSRFHNYSGADGYDSRSPRPILRAPATCNRTAPLQSPVESAVTKVNITHLPPNTATISMPTTVQTCDTNDALITTPETSPPRKDSAVALTPGSAARSRSNTRTCNTKHVTVEEVCGSKTNSNIQRKGDIQKRDVTESVSRQPKSHITEFIETTGNGSKYSKNSLNTDTKLPERASSNVFSNSDTSEIGGYSHTSGNQTKTNIRSDSNKDNVTVTENGGVNVASTSVLPTEILGENKIKLLQLKSMLENNFITQQQYDQLLGKLISKMLDVHISPDSKTTLPPSERLRSSISLPHTHDSSPMNYGYSAKPSLLTQQSNSEKYIMGKVVELSKDRRGCRIIQDHLKDPSSTAIKELIFKEIYPAALKLMQSEFGNHVIQQIFAVGNPRHVKLLTQAMQGHVLLLAQHCYGCRIVQKALQYSDGQNLIFEELKGHSLECVSHKYANFVIQRMVETHPSLAFYIISPALQGDRVLQLACSYFGYGVLLRVIEYCDDKQKEFLVEKLLENTVELMQDKFGNFLIQKILDNKSNSNQISRVLYEIKGHILQLSKEKYASNVIEKCLEQYDKAGMDEFLNEIIDKGGKRSPVLKMMKDKYANFVLQKLLSYLTVDQRKRIDVVIAKHYNDLKMNSYAQIILQHIDGLRSNSCFKQKI